LNTFRRQLEQSKVIIDPKLAHEQRLVLGASRFVMAHLMVGHGRPQHEVSMLDRFQNASLSVIMATRRFNESRGVGFISFIKPHLVSSAKRYEQGADSSIHQGDLIRIRMGRTGYHRLRNILDALSAKYRCAVEFADLSDDERASFTPKQLAEYQEHHM